MLAPKQLVFVFGSNEAGIHGGGAARFAYEKRGARMRFSYGHNGNSFAIPTKDQTIQHALPLSRISGYVLGFLAYAQGHPELQFQVTAIGCGLAGLTNEEIAPMFFGAPDNCLFDTVWQPLLGANHNFWGTF